MEKLNPWYVTGFCDGEAAFTYSRNGGAFAVYFSIKQKENNRALVEKIQEYFECVGTIYRGKESLAGRKRGHTKPYAYYRVTRNHELRRIIAHFDKYPLQSTEKHEAYLVWRQMVTHKIENFRDTDYDLLRALAEKLSHLNTQSRAFKSQGIRYYASVNSHLQSEGWNR